MKIKNLFIYSFFIILLSFTAPLVSPIVDNKANLEMSDNLSISPYVEETKWYYRLVGEEWQKRLWSLTYGEWITDWMPL